MMHGYQEANALEEARYAVMKASYEVKLILAEIAHKRFDPSQPRVPAGNSDGGQWTSTGGSGEGRTRVAQRAPFRRDPPNFGARRDNSGPRTTPIKIAGRTEWVTTAQANQYHSSAALAQSMTNLARRYNRSWRPDPTMVGNVPVRSRRITRQPLRPFVLFSAMDLMGNRTCRRCRSLLQTAILLVMLHPGPGMMYAHFELSARWR
jgi:hypothetical protein